MVHGRTCLWGVKRHGDEKIEILTAQDDEYKARKEFVENAVTH